MYSDAHKRLRRHREEAGFTQPALARLINDVRPDWNWHQTTIAKIESGNRAIKLEDLVAYGEVFGLSVDELVVSTEWLESNSGDPVDDLLNHPSEVVRRAMDDAAASKRRLMRFELERHRERVLELEQELAQLSEPPRG